MKHLMRLPAGLAMAGILLFGSVGCSIAPPATFYQLQPSVTEVASRENNVTVLLGPLRVADYLQRENLLQREADGSLSLDSFLLRAHRNYNVSGAMTLPIRQIGSHFILQTSNS